MPKRDPRDRFVYTVLKLMLDSFSSIPFDDSTRVSSLLP